MGLLGCEKGEEKRSRAEVTQLDLRLPSLRFHSNDQAAVEVVQHGGQCARWRGISAALRASPLTGPSAHGPGSSGTSMGQFALSVMQRAASAADPLRFIDAARSLPGKAITITLHDNATAAASEALRLGLQRTCVYSRLPASIIKSNQLVAVASSIAALTGRAHPMHHAGAGWRPLLTIPPSSRYLDSTLARIPPRPASCRQALKNV